MKILAAAAAILLIAVAPAWADRLITEDAASALQLETGTDILFTEDGFGTFIQTASTFSDVAHPVDVVMGSDVTAGNLILIWTSSTAAEDITSITDTQSNTWAEATKFQDVANDIGWHLWYTIAGSTGALTITVNATPGAGSTATYALEYEGPFAASPLDDTAAAQGVSAASSTGTITPTLDNSLLVAGHVLGADATEAGGWTNDIDELGGGVAFVIFSHTVQGAATADSGDATLASAYWINAGANFKPFAAVAGGAPTRSLLGVGQ